MHTSRYNIAHILPWPSIGGVEQATLRIAQGVESAQFKNIAFCLPGPVPVREMFAAAGFETSVYQAVDPSYRRPRAFLRASFELARELKRRRVDLVHCSDLLAAYYAALAGRLARVPVLCHVRCSHNQISRRDKSFLRPVNKFVFVSHDTWRNFGYPVTARRGVVVYDGVDVGPGDGGASARSVRSEFGIPEGTKIVGMVGRVAPAKDYPTLAKAAARVVAAYPDVRFLIVGDNASVAEYVEHYKEVRRLLDAGGVAKNFIFTGFRADVARLIGAMDIFVLSTHTEGMPLVVIEAMGLARPVIATAIGGIPEIVRDGESGLLHPHEDDAQLAAQILSLLRDEARAAKLGMAGRRSVEANWTREQFAASIKSLYRELLAGRRGRAVGGAVNPAERFEERRPDGI